MAGIVGALPVFGLIGRVGMALGRIFSFLFAPPVLEQVEVAGPFNRDHEPVVGPLRDRRERFRGRIVRRCRRHVLIVGIGEPRKHGRLYREDVHPPPRVATLLEHRFRDILVGPLAIKLARAAELRSDRQRGEDDPQSKLTRDRMGSRTLRISHGSRLDTMVSPNSSDALTARPAFLLTSRSDWRCDPDPLTGLFMSDSGGPSGTISTGGRGVHVSKLYRVCRLKELSPMHGDVRMVRDLQLSIWVESEAVPDRNSSGKRTPLAVNLRRTVPKRGPVEWHPARAVFSRGRTVGGAERISDAVDARP